MAEKVLSLLLLLSSFAYILLARELSFGTMYSPKSGFLPTLTGILAAILSVSIVIGQLLKKQSDTETDVVNWRKFVFVLIGLVFYVVLLGSMGYILATFIITFYLLKVTDTPGWISPCFISVGNALGVYFVFKTFLQANLP